MVKIWIKILSNQEIWNMNDYKGFHELWMITKDFKGVTQHEKCYSLKIAYDEQIIHS